MENFNKLMEKKKKEGKTLDPIERDAKMSVVNDMKKMASDQMGDKLSGLKKVTVASNSQPGLQEGLDKARDILGATHTDDPDVEHLEDETGEDLDHDNEEGENPAHAEALLGGEHGDEGHDEMSPEEIEEQLQHLLALKEKLARAKA